MRWQVMLVLSAVVCVAAVPCSADLITNGSFEDAGYVLGFNGGNFASQGVADVATLPGWTITSSYASSQTGRYPNLGWFVKSPFQAAEDGTLAVNLSNQGAQSAISQSFSAEVGMTYTVDYWEMYRDSTNELDASVTAGSGTLTLVSSTGTDATASGNGTATLTQTTGLPSAWSNYTFQFTASEATSITLRLTNHDSNLNISGVFLDNIQVTAVATPEPGTVALFISGMIGLLAYAWRKQR